MERYEPPEIVELGSVADFTGRDHFDLDYDGKWFRGPGIVDDYFGGGTTPTS
jgi:hypothetical protein